MNTPVAAMPVFQHRCLRRINELHERGATVLFVSHDAGAVRALCSRAILLRAGGVIADGKPVMSLTSIKKSLWSGSKLTTLNRVLHFGIETGV